MPFVTYLVGLGECCLLYISFRDDFSVGLTILPPRTVQAAIHTKP